MKDRMQVDVEVCYKVKCKHLRATRPKRYVCVLWGDFPRAGEAWVPEKCPFELEQLLDASEDYYWRSEGEGKGERR